MPQLQGHMTTLFGVKSIHQIPGKYAETLRENVIEETRVASKADV